MDRSYGRPKQQTEISGPEGGPISLVPPDDSLDRSTRAAELLARASHVLEPTQNGNGNGSHSDRMAPQRVGDVWWTDLGVRLPARFIPYWPHGPQEAFLALDCAEGLYGGAARGGKTVAMLMAALMCVDVPGYSALILRRESPELRGSKGSVKLSKEWLIPVLGTSAWNETHHRWVFPSGTSLRFGHMQREDDKFDFQGQSFAFVGFDELTHFTEGQYRSPVLPPRSAGGGAIIEGTAPDARDEQSRWPGA